MLWIEFLAAANADALVAAAFRRPAGAAPRRLPRVVDQLIERGLATGVDDVESAAATLSFLWSPASHQQLVVQGGWAIKAY